MPPIAKKRLDEGGTVHQLPTLWSADKQKQRGRGKQWVGGPAGRWVLGEKEGKNGKLPNSQNESIGRQLRKKKQSGKTSPSEGKATFKNGIKGKKS